MIMEVQKSCEYGRKMEVGFIESWVYIWKMINYLMENSILETDGTLLTKWLAFEAISSRRLSIDLNKKCVPICKDERIFSSVEADRS